MISCKNKCPLKAHRHNDDYTLGYCDGIDFGYNKAIDDFVELYKSKTSMEHRLIDELTEQLKRGKKNDNNRNR